MKKFLLLIVFACSLVSISAQNKNALAKSDSLFAKGVELYNQQKFHEAIPYFSESDKIDKAELDSLSNRRDYSSMWLASCYYNIGKIEIAKQINENYGIRPVDRRLTVISDSLACLSGQMYEQNPMEAARLLSETAQIEKIALGSDHPFYGNTLINLATMLTMCGMPEKKH